MAKTRVHELARELGMATKDLLDHAKAMGHYLKSASSTIEAPIERQIRDSLPGRLSTDTGLSPVATPPRTPRPTVKRAKPEAPVDWHVAWFSEFFEPADADAWVEAGIGKYEVAKAAYLGSHGVTPEVYARYSTDLHGRRTSELVDGEHTVLWLVEQIEAADRAQRARERANAQRWQESQELRRALD